MYDLDEYGGGKILPRPTKVRCSRQIVKRRNLTPLNRNARVLIWVSLALGRDRVELVRPGLPWFKTAILQNHSRISKDEINGSSNMTITVKLAIGMCIKSVLVCIKIAAVEYR